MNIMATTQSKRNGNGKKANGNGHSKSKSTPPAGKAPSKRGPHFRDTSRPPLRDVDSDAYELGCLIPTRKAPSATEPVRVRARPTESGWLGYLVAMSAAEGAREFSREYWTWGTAEQCAQLDGAGPSPSEPPPTLPATQAAPAPLNSEQPSA